MRNRLDVVAPTTARVVRFAGGWLFDRVMAGWEVVVHVTDPADDRPLQILGAHAADLEHTLADRVRGLRSHALAVDAELYGSDPRVQRLVLEAVGQRLTEVMLWGERCPSELDDQTGSVCHRLSVAARAFKAQALFAAAAPADAIGPTETFRSSGASVHWGQSPATAAPMLLQTAEVN